MKIKLDICCGTACYLLGAGRLMTIENELPSEWSEEVEIQIFPCLNLCMSEDLEGAPYVRIDGEIVAKATPERIITLLREKMKNRKEAEGVNHD